MSKIVPTLWFNTDAEEAAAFYTSLLPETRVVDVKRYGDINPDLEGTALTVEMEICGLPVTLLNGGEDVEHTHAMSLLVNCEDQDEVDRLWDGFLGAGGQELPCGWLKDRWGHHWQIIPEALFRLMNDEDEQAAKRVMQAMLQMKKIEVAELEKAYAG